MGLGIVLFVLLSWDFVLKIILTSLFLQVLFFCWNYCQYWIFRKKANAWIQIIFGVRGIPIPENFIIRQTKSFSCSFVNIAFLPKLLCKIPLLRWFLMVLLGTPYCARNYNKLIKIRYDRNYNKLITRNENGRRPRTTDEHWRCERERASRALFAELWRCSLYVRAIYI